MRVRVMFYTLKQRLLRLRCAHAGAGDVLS